MWDPLYLRMIAIFELTVIILLLFYYYRHPRTSNESGSIMVKEFSQNLTEIARGHGFDPVVGREKEIRRLIQILSRSKKNNAILIGESGVGKTAIVEELAKEIVEGRVPPLLQHKELLSLDLAGIVAGTKYRGDFEQRLQLIEREIQDAKGKVILFIDEIHTLVQAGEAEGGIGAADILKPALSRGEIQVIGATTTEDYTEIFRKDTALDRRFQPLLVPEVTGAMTEKILEALRERYEKHHHVKITDKALYEAVSITKHFLPKKHFPDKAIDLIDEAGAKVHLWAIQNPRHSFKLRDPEVTPQDVREVLSDWINKDLTKKPPKAKLQTRKNGLKKNGKK